MGLVQEHVANGESLVESFICDTFESLFQTLDTRIQFRHTLNLLSSFAAVVSCLLRQRKQYTFSRQPVTGCSEIIGIKME